MAFWSPVERRRQDRNVDRHPGSRGCIWGNVSSVPQNFLSLARLAMQVCDGNTRTESLRAKSNSGLLVTGPGARLWSGRRFNLVEVNTGGFFANINGRHGLQGLEIDNLNCARFGADAFDGYKCIRIIGRHDHAVQDFSFRWQPREFLTALQIINRN